MSRDVSVIDPADEATRLLVVLRDRVDELTKWKASQEENKRARIGKIFDALNDVFKVNCCTHEEVISLLEMMKNQVSGQYVAELNKE